MTLRDLIAFLAGGGLALVVVAVVVGSIEALAAGAFVVGCGLIAWWSWDRQRG